LPIGCEGFFPCFVQVGSLSNAAGVRMFQNGQRRLLIRKFGDEIRGSGQIEDVVIGKLFPVELYEIIVESAVKGGGLVRVFAISQWLGELRLNVQTIGQTGGRWRAKLLAKMLSNG